jgi:DUF4097 and DUF4098 domain-containing protein YvlB
VPLVLIVGCKGPSKRQVEIDGPALEPGRSVAVDVTNFNGSVRVKVSDRYKEPTVRVRLEAPGGTRLSTKKTLQKSIYVGAEIVQQEGGSVLRVLSRPSEEVARSTETKVRIDIRLPKCDGVLVHNSGGIVRLLGVTGGIQVENGSGATAGGDIDLRTGDPLVDPVALMTTEGNVLLQMGPNSRGALDITSESGDAMVRAYVGRLSDIKPTAGHWTGTLNDGSNPIMLRTAKGTARVLIMENAATSTPTKRPY